MTMDNLLKQAQAMKEKQQRELSETIAKGRSQAGAVRATMDGHKHLRSIHIDAEAIDPEALQQLEQQVADAVNEATEKMEAILLRKFGPSSGLPDLL